MYIYKIVPLFVRCVVLFWLDFSPRHGFLKEAGGDMKREKNREVVAQRKVKNGEERCKHAAKGVQIAAAVLAQQVKRAEALGAQAVLKTRVLL